MQLLKITTKPIEYKIEVEHATLKEPEQQVLSRDAVMPAAQVTESSSQNIRQDAGFVNTHPVAQPVQVQAYNTSVVKGANTADIMQQQTVAVSQLAQAQNYGGNLDSTLAQIPNAIDPSWEPDNINGVKEGRALENVKEKMEYTPSDVRLEIESMAKVEIEYLGSPRYVPPSSDPNYEPPEEE